MRPPESWSKAPLTLVIAVATLAAWAVVALFGVDGWVQVAAGFWPGAERYRYIDSGGVYLPLWITPLTATLIHGGPIHILFNLIVLVFCGRPVESVLGSLGMAILYVLGAYAAAGVQFVIDPSGTAPMVGASGAISAVIGAYAILFGRNKVKIGNQKLALWLNALWLMVTWVVLNVGVGVALAGADFLLGEGVQVAVGAHIGGFLIGVLVANPLLLLRYRKA
jgi:membrane associated rhomboid family serine protease